MSDTFFSIRKLSLGSEYSKEVVEVSNPIVSIRKLSSGSEYSKEVVEVSNPIVSMSLTKCS